MRFHFSRSGSVGTSCIGEWHPSSTRSTFFTRYIDTSMTKRINLAGRRFGLWTVLGFSGKDQHGNLLWTCVCDCGAKKPVRGSGSIKSAGCSSCRSKKKRAPFKALYTYFLSAARRSDREVKLTFDEFLAFTAIIECHYCGGEVAWTKHNIFAEGKSNAYNLDRKNNAIGYVRDNLVVCCKRCNRVKGACLTYDEMMLVGRRLKQERLTAEGT